MLTCTVVTMSTHIYGSRAKIQEFVHVKEKKIFKIHSNKLEVLSPVLKICMSVLKNYVF